ASELFGKPKEGLLGRPAAQVLPGGPFPQQPDALLDLGNIRDYEMDYRANGNEPRVLSISTRVMHDAAEPPEPVAVVCIARDITAQKRSEAQVLQQNEYLLALHETSLGLMNRLDLADLLEAIITRAGSLVGTEHGYVYVVDPDTDELVVQAGTGVFVHTLDYRLKRGAGVGGRVWETGKPMTVNDYL